MTLLSGSSGHGGKVCKQRTVKRCDSVRREACTKYQGR